MKTFVLGDPHGAYKAILQVFERSKFNYEKDQLICLGDVCDGWPEVYESVEELLKVKNLIYILGNHDQWALNWGLYGAKPEIWTSQGGKYTIESYLRHGHYMPEINAKLLQGAEHTLQSYQEHGGQMPESHIKLFRSAPIKYVENNKLFVHGGIDLNLHLEENDIDTLLWDRQLITTARIKGNGRPNYKLTDFDDIFVGHTTTQRYGTDKPLHCCEVWALDQGAGWSGKLTLMNVDTKEYFQSDLVPTLYPNEKGRGG